MTKSIWAMIVVFFTLVVFATSTMAQDETPPENPPPKEPTPEFYGEPTAPDPINLSVWDGLSGPDTKPIHEEYELSRGAVSVWNNNDSDADTKSDLAQSPISASDPDLMKVEIKIVKDPEADTVTLTYSQEQLKIWEDRKKTKEYKPDQIGTKEIPVSEFNEDRKILWAEGIKTSSSVRDSSIVASYRNASDSVKVTIVWAEFSEARTAETTITNGKPFNVIDDANIIKFFNDGFPPKWKQFQQNFGLLDEVSDNSAQGTLVWHSRARVGFLFQIKPQDAWKIKGLKFDMTRQAQTLGFALRDGGFFGSDSWQKHTTWQGLKPNPWSAEIPNDDNVSVDEDNLPSAKGYIGSIDSPGISFPYDNSASTWPYRAFRGNFREYVHIRFNGKSFVHPRKEMPATGGSAYARVSELKLWSVALPIETYGVVSKGWRIADSGTELLSTPAPADSSSTEEEKPFKPHGIVIGSHTDISRANP